MLFKEEDVRGILASRINFEEHGYYCNYNLGSSDWIRFWKEERSRCLNGYGYNGLRVTGDYYFYLNYCRLTRAILDSNGEYIESGEGFADFRDSDYEFYWHREIQRYGLEKTLARHGLSDESSIGMYLEMKDECKHGGYNMEVGKARQTGWSYKMSGIAANNYYHRRNSRTVFMGFDDTYILLLFEKFRVMKSFIDANTPWNHRNDFKNRWSDYYIRASKKVYHDNGSVTEGGYKSEVVGVTFGGDYINAARGLTFYDGIIDESGAFGLPGNLISVCTILDNSLRAGKYKTGMLTILGTSGDLTKSSYDLSAIHASPLTYGFMGVYDKWNPNNEGKIEGLFFPRHWGWLGFYDKAGNSDLAMAMDYEMSIREKMKNNGASAALLRKRMQEDPLNSAEAFGVVGDNMFPTIGISNRLQVLNKDKLHEKRGNAVTLYRGNGNVNVRLLPDFNNCIMGLYDNHDNVNGEVIIYEMPNQSLGRNYYKIGYDPVRQSKGSSLASILVFKPQSTEVYDGDKIVAEFIGRREDLDDIDEIFGMLCDLYNSEGMYENECPGTLAYFTKIGRLDILASQPDDVIGRSIKNSKVKRIYGCHIPSKLKESGVRYINNWLRREWGFDQEGVAIYNYDRLLSKRLAEELCSFDMNKGNFDHVSALIMVMIQLENSDILDARRDRSNSSNEDIKKSINVLKKLYANSR